MFSQKSQYALRALFDLARRYQQGLQQEFTKVADIAESQAIPPRFLEVILNQLKRAGFVDSRRGADGGYFLARSPKDITVGQVLRFVDGPLAPVSCMTDPDRESCPLRAACVFEPMWQEAGEAAARVYDHTTFHDLVEQDARMCSSMAMSYAI